MENFMDRRQFLCRSGLLSAGVLSGCRTCGGGSSEERTLKKYAAQFAWQGHPEAYIRHTLGLGKGSCSIRCSDEILQPDQRVEWVEITYVSPEEGIAAGGSVTLSVPPGPAEAAVQIDDSAKPAFMEVRADAAFAVELKYPPFEVQENCLVRKSRVEVCFPEGLEPRMPVSFLWHDVKLDTHARRWDGDSWRFQLLADHNGDGQSEELPQAVEIPKRSGPVDYLLVRCASMALPGEPVRVNVAAFDRFNNPAQSYQGKVSFRLEGDVEGNAPSSYRFAEEDRGTHLFSVSFDVPGFYWLIVEDEEGRTCRSNPIEIVAEEPARRLYWGDLHVHTEKSADARVWAHTTSTYAGSYNIGRYRYGLDFQANTDHHGLLQGNYTRDEWEEMQRVTNRADDPGQFVAIIANEYSHAQGDANAYFKEDRVPYFDHEPYESSSYPSVLFSQLHPYRCPLIPHHVAQNMRPFNWGNYDSALMTVCEIFSNHGRTEYLHNKPHYSHKKIPTMEGETWVEQLQAGKMMGCVAAGDDHWARPGTCGLTGVWAPSFDRAGIFDAIYNRHCIATTGDRAVLHVKVNGAGLGQAVPASDKVTVEVRAAAGSSIETIEIIKDGTTVHSEVSGSMSAELSWTDSFPGSWYYVRLTIQAQSICEEYMRGKTQFVWSSPVWVGASLG